MDRMLHELSKFLVPHESVKRRARAIQNCICRALQNYSASEQALFKVDRVGVYGSTGRGTSIATGADMDAYVFVRPVRPVPLASMRTTSSSSASSASTTSTNSTLTSSTTTLVLPASGSVSGSGSPADKPSTRDSNSKVTAETCATNASPEAELLSAHLLATSGRERNVSGSSLSSSGEPRMKERRTNDGCKLSHRRERYKPAPEEEKAQAKATDERENACGKDKNADSARAPSNPSAGTEEATERVETPTNASASATGDAAVVPAAPAAARKRGAQAAAAAFAPSELPDFDEISRELLRVLREAPELKDIEVRLDLCKMILAERTCLFVQGRVGGLDYDLMPSLCLSQDTDEQRRLVLATLKPDNPLFFTSIIETKVDFVKAQSPFAHELIRIAKYWNRTLYIKQYVRGRSVLIECVAIWAAIQEHKSKEQPDKAQAAAIGRDARRRSTYKDRKRQSLVSAFRRFLTFFANPDHLVIRFPPFEGGKLVAEEFGGGGGGGGGVRVVDPRGDLVPPKRWLERPLVLEPTPPYNNLAAALVGDTEQAVVLRATFARMARTTLERLHALMALLQDPGVKPLTDCDVLAQLFAPQPERTHIQCQCGPLLPQIAAPQANLLCQPQVNFSEPIAQPPLDSYLSGLLQPMPYTYNGAQVRGFLGQTGADAQTPWNATQAILPQAGYNTAFQVVNFAPGPPTLIGAPQQAPIILQTPAGLVLEALVTTPTNMVSLPMPLPHCPAMLCNTMQIPSQAGPPLQLQAPMQPSPSIPFLVDATTGLAYSYLPAAPQISPALVPNAEFFLMQAASQHAGSFTARACWPANPALTEAGPFALNSTSNYNCNFGYNGLMPLLLPQTMQEPIPALAPSFFTEAPYHSFHATNGIYTGSQLEVALNVDHQAVPTTTEERSAIAEYLIPSELSISLRLIVPEEATASDVASEAGTGAEAARGWTEEFGARVRKRMLQPLLVYCAHNARILLAAADAATAVAAACEEPSVEREHELLGSIIMSELTQSFPGCNVKLANKEQVLRAGRALPAGPVPYITAHAAQKQADATDTKTSVKPISTTTSSRASSCAMKDFEASLCFPVGFPKPKWEMSLVAQWATDFDMGAK